MRAWFAVSLRKRSRLKPSAEFVCVADGTYYVASLLAQSGGADQDIACCAQALSEMRWAFAKSEERTER